MLRNGRAWLYFFSLKLSEYRKALFESNCSPKRKTGKYRLIDAVVGTPNDQGEKFSNREAKPKER